MTNEFDAPGSALGRELFWLDFVCFKRSPSDGGGVGGRVSSMVVVVEVVVMVVIGVQQLVVVKMLQLLLHHLFLIVRLCLGLYVHGGRVAWRNSRLTLQLATVRWSVGSFKFHFSS